MSISLSGRPAFGLGLSVLALIPLATSAVSGRGCKW
jgi:hypothetical protein